MDHITCILNDPATARSVLQAGKLLSLKFGNSRMRVLHPRPGGDPGFMPTEEVMTDDRRERFARRQNTLSIELTSIFQASGGRDHGGTVLEEVEGDVSEIVAVAAREAFLIVAGVADGHEQATAAAMIQTVLIERASAIVVVPVIPPSSIGARPAVAWKAGVQLYAAIDQALKLLLTAEQVHVLLEARQAQDDAGLQDLLMALQRHAVPFEIHHVELAGRHAGELLIQEAHNAGCDLLVMGAHTKSWFRDFLLGGRSKNVLAHLDLPVLLHG